jgi:glyoxylase-like metal-dependent hydrolase (beta-lactamase superfamily II)
MHRVDINTYMKSMNMVTTKPKMLLRLNVLLLTLVFTVSITYFPSLHQQQYNQNIVSAQQQADNETTPLMSNASNITTTAGSIPENARGPAIPQDKGYLVQELGNNLYFLTNGAYNTMFMVTDEGVIAVDAPPAIGDNYLKAIAEVTDKPVKYVVYSHSHADHIGAANIFPDNATYIAHADTAAQLRIANDSNRPVPTVTFTDNYELNSGNQSLSLDYYGSNHEAGNVFIYAPAQKTLMLVDIVYPGWIVFDGLAGSENVTGFIRAHDIALNNYDFDKFVGGHVTRLGTPQDIITQKEFVSDLKAAAQTGLKNVNFSSVAQEVGGFSNPWLVTKTYFDTITGQCTDIMKDKWESRLGGVNVFLADNCNAMTRSLRVD